MRIDIDNYRWVGREGWNIRFKLQVWKNINCTLLDPRGFEYNGYKYWEMYKDEPCGQIMHSKKEMKDHLRHWHQITF